ncbi:LrgB family protein [Echinimonas agarilytica]|uniref:LrgB family protein n=1 Tax=Echinimonas agarilytica TaxID=1215918 RepID=A0AA41W7C4_9GAMM|nr:LrgB family protein [Echinimonas agarilytica]MCM2680505.1 LrgB family protein [Echinimonas agarilytica]
MINSDAFIVSFAFASLTVMLFVSARWLYTTTRISLLNPVVVSIIVLAAGLLGSDIPYQTYEQGGHWIDWFLEPSVVALGYPLYQQLQEIKRDAVKLISVCAISSCVGILSMIGICALLGLGKDSLTSTAPKAVTTAIAMVISEEQGGIPALTALTVIYAGLLGSLVAIPLMNLTKIHTPKAQGIAMGSAAHALGTARIREEGHTHGAYSALALVLCAIFTALLTPILLPIALRLLGY